MGEPTEESTDPKIERPDEVIEDIETPEEVADAVTGGVQDISEAPYK